MYRTYYPLNEASTYESLYSNEDIIEKLGDVKVYDSEKKEFVTVKASDVIKVCSDALYRMQRDYSYLYQFITKCKLMYLPTFPSDITNTMAVDSYNNLWMNLTFVYDECKMNSDRVFGILFHELFHIFFDHLLRFENEFPKSMFASAGPGVYKRANMKANICMDYEVNASMVDDGIVSPDFFKVMDGLYKKEYTGMTWEEILHKFGDKEYNDWLERNGQSLDDVEKKILDAIQDASKILLDPESDEADKRFARRELQKKMDEILGKQDRGEKSLQDEIDELMNTKLADHGEIAMDLDDLSDDLNRNPANMSSEELEKTLRDIDKLMDDIAENADEMAGDFNKTGEEIYNDAAKAKEALKDAMKKINSGSLTKEEKKDLMDKAKDTLEDIISDEAEKKKLEEKRKERDAAKEAAKKEKLKKTHPIRKLIIVMKNLAELHEIDLISEKTLGILNDCMADLEVLTEKTFGDMKKSDMKSISANLDKLKDSLLPDMVKLIENETILQKTEEDMQHILDVTFDHVFNAFRRIFDTTIDDDAKGSLMKMAAQKMRTIGKVLKTQKKWRVGDDFKKGYMDEMKRLMELRKEGGDEALFKELFDKGVIMPFGLDENGMKLWKKLMSSGEIEPEDVTDSDGEIYSYSDFNDGTEPYEGKMYYATYLDDDSNVVLELSDIPDGLEDSDYAKFGVRFEKDFPEYRVEERMESIFEVYIKGTNDPVDFDELNDKLDENPEYVLGDWETE